MDKRAEEIRKLSQKGPIQLDRGGYEGGTPPRAEVTRPANIATREGRINCPVCDEDISAKAKKCRHCGEVLDASMRKQQAAEKQPTRHYTRNKSKIVAGIFGILLGFVGVHKYYLGRVGQGILYTLFFWTGIPALLGLIEGIVYLTMDDERFWEKYG